MNIVIQNHLLRAQHRMKAQADKGRFEREFAVGDQVYLKLQPYVQMTVACRSNQKLSFKYFGPFRIIQRAGKMAYKLQLPTSSKIHPVVHVSVLKLAIPPATEVCPDLPDVCFDPDHIALPEAILQCRLVKQGAATIAQVLVKWHELPAQLATWESLEDTRHKFPSVLAWGHASAKGGGIVTNCDSPGPPGASEAQPRRSTRQRRPINRD